MPAFAPPIKCQGIKTALADWIAKGAAWNGEGVWIEPFMGSGAVGFNVAPDRAAFSDANPHLIAFYGALERGEISAARVRDYLTNEGARLANGGAGRYYEVRDRFNANGAPLDFLFLNRACFNGLMRFNAKGEFNVPFCRKPERFSKSLITKIVNQTARVEALMQDRDWAFQRRDFREAIMDAKAGDFIYCDPPYAGRNADFYNSWSEADEFELRDMLGATKARFALSTWHGNRHRINARLPALWSGFRVIKRDHFYHVGGREVNRGGMTEALVMNYDELGRKIWN